MKSTRILACALAVAAGLGLSTDASADRVLIDLGGGGRQAIGQWDTFLSAFAPPPASTVGGLYWNSQPDRDGAILPDLMRASDGASTGISMDITADFAGSRVTAESLDPSLGYLQYTKAAYSSSLYTQTGSAFEVGQLLFSGLDATGNTTYDFTFYGYRNSVTDVRETTYSLVGGNGLTSAVLNASSNLSEVVTASGVTADANGEILLNVSAGPDNVSGFGYLNLIDIEYSPNQNPSIPGDINGDGFVGVDDLNIVLVNWNNGTPPNGGTPSIPEPATLGLLGAGLLAVCARRRQS